MLTEQRNPRILTKERILSGIAIENGTLKITLSLLDQLLASYGAFPLAHVTNATNE